MSCPPAYVAFISLGLLIVLLVFHSVVRRQVEQTQKETRALLARVDAALNEMADMQ